LRSVKRTSFAVTGVPSLNVARGSRCRVYVRPPSLISQRRRDAGDGFEVLIERDERIVEVGEHLPLLLRRLQEVVQCLHVCIEAADDAAWCWWCGWFRGR
jgi:hypothetical protein